MMTDLIPSEFFLSQNYPNPFSEKTIIKFCVPICSKVKLLVFNTKGILIKKLIDEALLAGTYEIEFNANKLSSGVYFYRLMADNFIETKSLLLL